MNGERLSKASCVVALVATLPGCMVSLEWPHHAGEHETIVDEHVVCDVPQELHETRRH